MECAIAPIVEGHGDVRAFRVLVNRLLAEGAAGTATICTPIRTPRGKIVNDEELAKYAQIALSNIRERGVPGGVLLLFDADDDCAVELAEGRRTILEKETGVPSECVLAVREYETWLVAGDTQHDFDGDAESKRNPKAVLKEWYGRYTETADQPSLTARMDPQQARTRCRSFRAFENALLRLVDKIQAQRR